MSYALMHWTPAVSVTNDNEYYFKVYLIFFLLEGMKLFLVGNFDIMSFKKLFKAKNNFKAEVGIKNS